MATRLSKQWDALRASYWFVPSLMTALAVMLWATLRWLETALGRAGTLPLPWLYHDSTETARTLLLAIAGATIGIIGVVFSITMVPLTIAASQLGPRLLRTFLRDTGTQLVLGTFISTFVFCMLVLLQLRDDSNTVPQLLVSAGFVLALASLGVLIYFIDHVAVSLQAPRVVAAVVAELDTDIARTFPARQPDPAPSAASSPTCLAESPYIVPAARSGYVQARDDDALLQLAVDHDLLIALRAESGAFVVAGTPLAHVWPATAGAVELERTVNAAYILGVQRTLVQDIEFGINELVEVAVRALSPAINDPFTAMTCLDWLGHTLCQLCARQLPSPCQRDQNGTPRLLSSPLTFGRLADAAFNQIRAYGQSSATVTIRLLDTLDTIGGCALTDEQREAVLRHVQLVVESCQGSPLETAAQQAVLLRAKQIAQSHSRVVV